MRYRDKSGERILESTGCQDWQEAQKKLRDRLQARDQNALRIVRRGEQMLFGDWADFFLERYSRPPIRTSSTAKSSSIETSESGTSTGPAHNHEFLGNLPITVKDAARSLFVSPQTVYLWVERKQIPHLRVMGRNFRFLISDLEPFRVRFKQRGGEWRDQPSMTVSFTDVVTAEFGGCATAILPVPATWNQQAQKTGTKRNGVCANVSKPATTALWR
jgi:excisionase family DNA binding protein